MRPFLLCLSLLLAGQAIAQDQKTRLILSASFVNELKNRATVVSRMKVLKITPRSGSQEDGDIHIYGQDDQVGLNTVAEVINAHMDAQKPAVKFFRSKEANQETVSVEGVWRMWCEHGGRVEHRQGVMKNPEDLEHVYEIHPVTRVDNFDLTGSFIACKERNSYTEAKKAFAHYDRLKCSLKRSDDSIYIALSGARYNYARFNIKVPEKIKDGVDCVMWYSDVYDASGAKLPGDSIRIIVVKGTRSYTDLIAKSPGKMITVIGEPRLNLDRIYRILEAQPKKNEYSEYVLPYEMIITAVEE